MAVAGLTTPSMAAAMRGRSKRNASISQVMSTSSGSRVRRLGTMAMSSNPYARRPDLPIPISTSATACLHPLSPERGESSAAMDRDGASSRAFWDQAEPMDVDPSPQVWVMPHCIVGASSIAGRGLFAGADVAAGDLVLRLGGHLVTTAELEALIAEANAAGRYVDTITVHEERHLVLPDSTIVHFAHHSCAPNLWHDGALDVRARRDVRAGEELTIDYGTNSGAPGFAMDCTCGAPECRGRITSDDWRITDLQRRYDGHWVPALARRIDESRPD